VTGAKRAERLGDDGKNIRENGGGGRQHRGETVTRRKNKLGWLTAMTRYDSIRDGGQKIREDPSRRSNDKTRFVTRTKR
jgi:hypothetical protein